eukprot:3994895-Pyramimonas_sp.AAC.1
MSLVGERRRAPAVAPAAAAKGRSRRSGGTCCPRGCSCARARPGPSARAVPAARSRCWRA